MPAFGACVGRRIDIVETPVSATDFLCAFAVVLDEGAAFAVVVDVFSHPDLIFENDGSVFLAVSRVGQCIVFDVLVEKVFLGQAVDEIVSRKVPPTFVANVELAWKRIARETRVVYGAFLVVCFVFLCIGCSPTVVGADEILAVIFAIDLVRTATVRFEKFVMGRVAIGELSAMPPQVP